MSGGTGSGTGTGTGDAGGVEGAGGWEADDVITGRSGGYSGTWVAAAFSGFSAVSVTWAAGMAGAI